MSKPIPDPGQDRSGETAAPPMAAPAAAPARKKPYEPPRILHREPLEVMASVCAPSPPAKTNPGFCPQGPISS